MNLTEDFEYIDFEDHCGLWQTTSHNLYIQFKQPSAFTCLSFLAHEFSAKVVGYIRPKGLVIDVLTACIT